MHLGVACLFLSVAVKQFAHLLSEQPQMVYLLRYVDKKALTLPFISSSTI
jgi:hypothetical protein